MKIHSRAEALDVALLALLQLRAKATRRSRTELIANEIDPDTIDEVIETFESTWSHTIARTLAIVRARVRPTARGPMSPHSEPEPQPRECRECGLVFFISANEAAFFLERHLELPLRCRECREKRKLRRAADEQRPPANHVPR